MSTTESIPTFKPGIQEKIRKLLALGERGGTEAEAPPAPRRAGPADDRRDRVAPAQTMIRLHAHLPASGAWGTRPLKDERPFLNWP